MALDLRLVAHAAQAESVKFAAERCGNRFADAGLTHPRRAHQQQNGSINTALEGAHC